MNIEQLVKLIHAEEQGLLSKEAMKDLLAWRRADDANEALYHLYKKLYSQVNEIAVYDHVDSDKAWEVLNKHIQEEKKIRRPVFRYLSAAASVACVLIFSVVLYQKYKAPTEYIAKDFKEVVIQTPKGLIQLDEMDEMELVEVNGAKFFKENGQLVYAENKASVKQEFNTLYVPRAMDYSMTFSDGTKVTVNAESKLRFPTVFNGKERRIWLESGEIFLDVAHDAEHPFVLCTKGIDVRVLGTRFNVNAYDDQNTVIVTLEQGGIRISAAEDTPETFAPVEVVPGQQFKLDRENKLRSLEKVDVSLYTAWLRGEYYFENERLENIMQVLARWYDYDVVYDDDAFKAITFSGRVKRYDDINIFLLALENLEGIQCEVKGKRLIIR